MKQILYYELKKFFKNKVIIISLSIICILALLGVFFYSGSKINTVFGLQFFLITSFGEYFLTAFFISITGYVYSLELDCKTIKIIKMKNIKAYKIYIVKFLTGAIYSFIIFSSIYLICFINISRFSIKPMEIAVRNVEINTVFDSFRFTSGLFAQQFLASLFILALVLFITILTHKKTTAIIIVPIITWMASFLTTARNKGLEFLIRILPLNSQNIYQEYHWNAANQRIICLLIYTLILSLVSIYVYKTREIKE